MVIGGKEVFATYNNDMPEYHIEKEDPDLDYTWPKVLVHTHLVHMTRWCIQQGLEYGSDYHIQTFRLKGRNQNSHFWYFKDQEVATLFAIQFR